MCIVRNLSPENQEELVDLYCQLCKDDTPMVRRVAALNLNDFVRVVSLPLSKTNVSSYSHIVLCVLE